MNTNEGGEKAWAMEKRIDSYLGHAKAKNELGMTVPAIGAHTTAGVNRTGSPIMPQTFLCHPERVARAFILSIVMSKPKRCNNSVMRIRAA
ncbi:hypothetical protein HYQ46_005627 [Verticillium longisporum]|nr:hypothetical protein HYQ44_000616 [Verticillium longisporum]KAG7145628.1 hypothetical protein HYQ46_005627 [Verticillium longisporum]